jgi:HK97 gp10 family phage protein
VADFDIQVLGLKELDAALQNLAYPATRRALRKGMRAGANVVRDEVRARAPVKSGNLKRKIRTRERSEDQGNMRFAVEVPRSAFYGKFFEYGTSKMAAKPFMRPAAEAKTEAAVTMMRDSLQIAISLEMSKVRR